MNLSDRSELLNDPQVAVAKQLLLDISRKHRQKIDTITPPLAELKMDYDKFLHQFEEFRGGKLWFPYLGSGLGNGPFVKLLDGSVKYDLIEGVGAHFLGHSHPAMLEACIDASLSDIVLQGNLQQNGDSVELLARLTKSAELPHCILSTSGAMATENGLKIAFQKNFPAKRILAFDRCFIGRTTTLAQITDKPSYREGLPDSIHVDYVPYYDASQPEESTKKAVETLKRAIKRYPKSHAAMIFELVQGEGGIYPGTTEFFSALMEILKSHHIAVFVDEVQTFGRTHALFAFQHFQLQKYIDICTIGKLSLVCATLFSSDYKPRPGLISQTFTSSTAAIHCAKTILEMLLSGGFYGSQGLNAKFHASFVEKFKDIEKRNPGMISGPYGVGAMIAFTPYNGESEKVTRFIHALFEAGILAFPAGENPTRVRFLPPVAAMKIEEIEMIMDIVEKTLRKCA